MLSPEMLFNWHSEWQLGVDPSEYYVPVAYSSGAVPKAFAWFKPADVDPAIAGQLWAFFEADINGVRYSNDVQLIQLGNGYWWTVGPAAMWSTFAGMQGEVADYREHFETKWYAYSQVDAAEVGGVTPLDGLSSQEQGVIRHAGDADSCLYVTYKAPNEGTALYHTVVHTGCKAAEGVAGGDTAVFDAIWAKFESKSIPKIDIKNGAIAEGDALWYYGPKRGTHSAEQEMSLIGLLGFGYGRCQAWCHFQYSVLGVQGIACVPDSLTPKPLPSGITPIAVILNQNVSGQGGGLPGAYRFAGHLVIRYGNRIYDPSYGLDFSTISEWEDALLDELVLPGEVFVPQQVGVEELEWGSE